MKNDSYKNDRNTRFNSERWLLYGQISVFCRKKLVALSPDCAKVSSVGVDQCSESL